MRLTTRATRVVLTCAVSGLSLTAGCDDGSMGDPRRSADREASLALSPRQFKPDTLGSTPVDTSGSPVDTTATPPTPTPPPAPPPSGGAGVTLPLDSVVTTMPVESGRLLIVSP